MSDQLRADDREATAVDDRVIVIPCSFNQQRLWFLEQLERTTGVYNIPSAHRLRGRLDVPALAEAVDEIVERHEALRTTFGYQDGELVQFVATQAQTVVEVVDLSAQPPSDEELRRLVQDEVDRRIAIDRELPLRVRLIRLAADDHVLVVTIHHIVADGWSVGLFFSELGALYRARIERGEPALPELPIQFGDYVEWQREQLTGPVVDAHAKYWAEQLAGVAPFDLPMDHPRPRVQTYRGGARAFVVPPDLASALRTVGRHEGATLFMVLTAALHVLLGRHAGVQDVTIGVPVADRGRPELQPLIGFFVNTLVVRGDFSGNPSFLQLLARVRAATLGAHAHQDLPFDRIVELCQPERDLSRSPLFQVFFSMEALRQPLDLIGIDVGSVPLETTTAKFDLSLYLEERADGLGGRWEYNADLFEPASVDRLAARYLTLLQGIAASPTSPVAQLPLLPAEERRQIVETWNATATDYPRTSTAAMLFEEQAARRPDAVAVEFEDASLTYAALNARANQLAHVLRARGVAAGVSVGICLERSIDMVVGLLAILKAGGTYVPLDPGFPRERLAFMLADSGAAVLLTQASLRDLPQDPARPLDAAQVVCVDEVGDECSTAPTTNLGVTTGPEDLAYVLYTSGSTGKPKGVEIPHRAFTNFLWAMRHEPGCSERDVLVAVTTLSFDIAGLELFLPLITGARVVLVSRAVAADGGRLRDVLASRGATILQATPATWRLLLAAGWTGTPGLKALCGGEPLPPELVAPLLDRTAELWNMYGPTETTVWSSVERVGSADAEITVGRPIANTTFYIVDPHGQPVPVGVPGELWIGGDGVARGYRQRPDLTAERFIADPFVPGARVYRTGDLAKYRADGRVVHLGRLDHQVKLRGYRIELGEIEAALVDQASVRQAVVALREDRPGDPHLVAYVVAADGAAPALADVRPALRQRLPDYMVPTQLVVLDGLPLTPNGKVDRKALPAPEVASTSEVGALTAPRTPTETGVAEAFAAILQMTDVGAETHFFESGGHSLLAIRLMSRLGATFEIEIPLHVLFDAPTVAQLSDWIAERTGAQRVAHGSERLEEPDPDLVERLTAAWSRVLGDPQVPVDRSFFDLQGPRDLVDAMFREVRREFGFFAEGIPRGSFLREPTVTGLARLLHANRASSSGLVVPLHGRGSRPPLFLVHAGGGYVFFYRALALRLGADQPVYGIRAATVSDAPPTFDQAASIEQLATRYLQEIRTIQPEGPYLLGGACLGGAIAAEMARQLQAEGEQVAIPILAFDAYLSPERSAQAPESYQAHSMTEYALKRARAHLRESRRLGTVGALRYLAGKALRNATEIPSLAAGALRTLRAKPDGPPANQEATGRETAIEQAQRQLSERFLQAALRLLRDYRPGHLDVDLALFRAAESPDPRPGWEAHVTGRIDDHLMPGNHLDMMEEPAVDETAALVLAYLEQASRPRSTAPDGSAALLSTSR